MLTPVELKYEIRRLAPQLGAGKRAWTYRFRFPNGKRCKIGRLPYADSFHWVYWPTNEEYQFRLTNVDHHNLILDYSMHVISFEAQNQWDSRKAMWK